VYEVPSLKINLFCETFPLKSCLNSAEYQNDPSFVLLATNPKISPAVLYAYSNLTGCFKVGSLSFGLGKRGTNKPLHLGVKLHRYPVVHLVIIKQKSIAPFWILLHKNICLFDLSIFVIFIISLQYHPTKIIIHKPLCTSISVPLLSFRPTSLFTLADIFLVSSFFIFLFFI
jgi:hypothetical protein